jgi:predicted O-linked N-acetylglucosamine transferase (SPINDLY family)
MLQQLLQTGQLEKAYQLAQQHCQQHANEPDAWRNLAIVCEHSARLNEAIAAMRKVLLMAPGRAEAMADLAAMLDQAGSYDEADALLQQAIATAPTEPMYVVRYAAFLLANARTKQAMVIAERLLRSHPQHRQCWRVLADSYYALNQFTKAESAYLRASDLGDGSATVYYNLAMCAAKLGNYAVADQRFDQTLAIDPKLYLALSQKLFWMRTAAIWQGLAEHSARLQQLVQLGVAGITPFSFLAETTDAKLQRECAAIESRKHAAHAASLASKLTRNNAARQVDLNRPRVGFISNGFGQHPTGLLAVEMFEYLAALPIDLRLLSLSVSDNGPIRQRIAASSAIIDLNGQTELAIADRVLALDLDVLVDMRGYGDGGVPLALALIATQSVRPIIVNFMAYPGTMGSSFHDYVIADQQVLPPELQTGFSETVSYLPCCFQPYDSKALVGPVQPRAHYGLPDTGFVFASFNNGYKITPEVFAAWMQILQSVPDSVLWLLCKENDQAFCTNLRSYAELAGVASERIVFLKKLPHDQYLAAYAHVDLFFDTWIYGAHTTARDAAFCGVPILTWAGDSFASRVAYSINQHQQADALCARSASDYVTRAIDWATNRQKLHELRQNLVKTKAILFDSKQHAEAMLTAFQRMLAVQRGP